jgi:hypothetical protein
VALKHLLTGKNTGDWLIRIAWCLLCGCIGPVPCFQNISFAVLLVHRADRDNKTDHDKYGDDSLEYKKRAPHLFIPYVN